MYDILGGQSANLLILDFGASSLEISLIEVTGYESKVISTFGTLLLGGIEFDERLMNICIHKFTSQYGNDLHFDDGMLHKLRFECEKAKKTLQERNNARIKIDLPNGEIVETQVTKTEFDENCKDLYNNVIHLFIQ
ncbi:heat shock protein 70kDa protein 6-like protein, partial [Leptotrombidium deliense]